jgi:hypothetical protein
MYVHIDDQNPGGVARWSSNPLEARIRVRVPLGCKFFKENITLMLCKLT